MQRSAWFSALVVASLLSFQILAGAAGAENWASQGEELRIEADEDGPVGHLGVVCYKQCSFTVHWKLGPSDNIVYTLGVEVQDDSSTVDSVGPGTVSSFTSDWTWTTTKLTPWEHYGYVVTFTATGIGTEIIGSSLETKGERLVLHDISGDYVVDRDVLYDGIKDYFGERSALVVALGGGTFLVSLAMVLLIRGMNRSQKKMGL